MTSLERAIAVVPARAASSRFPNKVLTPLNGRPMIEWVWRAALGADRFAEVAIATDSDEVRGVAEKFGAKVVMTPVDVPSGTDRVALVAKDIEADIVVNVQGDEPLIRPEDLNGLVVALRTHKEWDIATLVVSLPASEGLTNNNVVKVQRASSGMAENFSREPLQGAAAGKFWKHIGIYAYRREALFRFCELPQSEREKRERLEQLRALDNGMVIGTVVAMSDTTAVDVPEDREIVERRLVGLSDLVREK